MYNRAARETRLNGGELVLTEGTIFSILDKLRISQKDTLFEKVVAEEWKNLELKDDPNPTLLENLLIQVIEDLYDEKNAELAAKRECAIKHDISLLMFGLLDGYYHTIISQDVKKSVKSSTRYDEYLATNVYVKLEYPDEGTYEQIDKKDKIKRSGKQNRPLNHITKIAGDCKIQIANKLFDLIKDGAYQNCSQEAVVDEQTGQRTDLPKPRFTEENFSPKTSTGKIYPDDEKKALRLFTYFSQATVRLLSKLRLSFSVPIWATILVIVLFLIVILSRCSYSKTHYRDRKNGIEYEQTFVSYGSPIEVTAPSFDDDMAKFPISQPVDEEG